MSGKAWTSTAITLALPPVRAARAQQWLVNNQIMETAIWEGAMKKHEELPDICAEYSRYSRYSSATGQRRGAPQPSASGRSRGSGSAKFSPDAGDDSVRKVTDEVGVNAQERQRLLQIAQAGKAVFEQKYGPKAWKNDLAGAYDGRDPDPATQDRLFDALSATLAQELDLAEVTASDNTPLYDMLIAGGGVPLLFYVDGKQQSNGAEVGQAKAVAAAFSRRPMKAEPPALAAMGQ